MENLGPAAERGRTYVFSASPDQVHEKIVPAWNLWEFCLWCFSYKEVPPPYARRLWRTSGLPPDLRASWNSTTDELEQRTPASRCWRKHHSITYSVRKTGTSALLPFSTMLLHRMMVVGGTPRLCGLELAVTYIQADFSRRAYFVLRDI